MADDPPEDVVVRRWPRRLLRWGLATLALIAAAVALLYLALDSRPGRRFVAQRIAGLSFDNGMKIGVGRIDGSIYGRMTLHDLTLSDPRGVFLAAREVRVDWRPFSYARSHVDIRTLLAPTATLSRRPQFRVTAPSDAPLLPDLDIDIGRLTVSRLMIGPAVAGRSRVAAIDGAAHIADRRAQVALKAAVIAGAGREGGDRIDLRLDAVPERNRLAIALALDAPAGGVVAGMAGFKAPLALRLDGRGDWRKWDGRLRADLDHVPLARLALTARDGRFGLAGPAAVARLVTGPTAALLGPVTMIGLDTSWADRQADIRARVASPSFTLTAGGRADLGRNRFDAMRLAFTLLKPGAIAPNLAGRNIRAEARLDGAFAAPSVDYAITATTLAFNTMALHDFRAAGVARIGKDHTLVPIAARAATITGLDTAAGGRLANVRLDGDLAIDWPRVVSDNLRIRSDRVDATAILLADAGKGLYTGALQGRINAYRIDSVGLFAVDTHADVKTLAPTGFALVGRVRAHSTRLFNDGVRSFLGGNLVASSDVAYGTDGIVRFSRLRLAAPQLRVTDGRGSYAPSGRISLTAAAQSRRYGPLALQLAGTAASPRALVTDKGDALFGVERADGESLVSARPRPASRRPR